MNSPSKTTHIFLHNFRCTGNSLNLALRNYFMHDHVKYGQVNDKTFTYDEVVTLARKRQPKFILGHNSFGLHRQFDFPCRYFVNFRDPVERLVSGFVTWTKVGGQNIEEYYRDHLERSNGMTYRLLGFGKRDQQLYDFNLDQPIESLPEIDDTLFQQAIDNLSEFADVILVSEMFSESIVNMEETLQLPDLVCPQGIFYNQSKTFISAKHFPSTILEELRDANQWDYKLYDHAKQRLQSMLAERDDAFWEKVRIRKLMTDMMKEPHLDVVDGTMIVNKLQNGLNALLGLGRYDDVVPVVSLFINSVTVDIKAAQNIVQALRGTVKPDGIKTLQGVLEGKIREFKLAS